jgi:D-inositol-3-phosphate glycosyltransferase
MKPLHVLFVLEYFWPQVGGIENLFVHLARALVQRGHRCTVLTTRLEQTPAYETYEGIEIHRLGSEHSNRYLFTLTATPAARALAKDADLIHTTTYNGALPAWLAAKLTKKPVLITVHELLGAVWHALPDTGVLPAFTFRLLERLCMALPFDHYVAVSRATRNALRQIGIHDKRLSTVYNGHDTSEWRVDPELLSTLRPKLNPGAAPLIGYYGRPGVTKGVEVLIEAFPLLLKRIPEARLLLLLGGYPQARRERLVTRAQQTLADAVTIVPSVPRGELPTYLSLCDCVAVPSLTEGFGFTTVEASSLGCVVVASDVGSIPEVISGRYLLVPPNNPSALGNALYQALRTEVSPSPSRSFSMQTMIDGYEALYRSLMTVKVSSSRQEEGYLGHD